MNITRNFIHFFLFLFFFQFSPFAFASEIEVSGAGVREANGIYKQQGTFQGHPKYVKGQCEIRYKGCRSKWMLHIGKIHYYKNNLDLKICPLTNWQIACGAKKTSFKIPKFKIVTKEIQHGLNNK